MNPEISQDSNIDYDPTGTIPTLKYGLEFPTKDISLKFKRRIWATKTLNEIFY